MINTEFAENVYLEGNLHITTLLNATYFLSATIFINTHVPRRPYCSGYFSSIFTSSGGLQNLWKIVFYIGIRPPPSSPLRKNSHRILYFCYMLMSFPSRFKFNRSFIQSDARILYHDKCKNFWKEWNFNHNWIFHHRFCINLPQTL